MVRIPGFHCWGLGLNPGQKTDPTRRVKKKQNKTVLYLNAAKQSRSSKFSSQEKENCNYEW